MHILLINSDSFFRINLFHQKFFHFYTLFLTTFSFIRFKFSFIIKVCNEISYSHSFFRHILMFLVQLDIQMPDSESYSSLRLLMLFRNQIHFLIQILFDNQFNNSYQKIRFSFQLHFHR